MIWLAEHLTGLAWIGCAWSLMALFFAGALYRHTPRTDDLEPEHAAFYARCEAAEAALLRDELHPNATHEQDA